MARLAGAEFGGFEDRAQYALGRYWIILHVFAVARQHAAEILRPRPVHRRVEDHMADMAGAKLLRVRRKGEEYIQFAGGKELYLL